MLNPCYILYIIKPIFLIWSYLCFYPSKSVSQFIKISFNTLNIVHVDIDSSILNKFSVDLVDVLLPENVFVAVFIDVLESAVASWSEISKSGLLNTVLSKVDGFLFSHFWFVELVEGALGEGGPTSAAEQVSLESEDCFTHVDHLEVDALVVEAADERAKRQAWISLGPQHAAHRHWSLAHRNFAVFLESHQRNCVL